MLVQYKKDYEKTAMGLLSYLPDFKNLQNLQDEMKLIETDNEFQLYLYRNQDANIIGVVGTQETDKFIVIRYLSMAPGFRDNKYQRAVLYDLIENHSNKKINTLPEYTYLLKLRNNDQE